MRGDIQIIGGDLTLIDFIKTESTVIVIVVTAVIDPTVVIQLLLL